MPSAQELNCSSARVFDHARGATFAFEGAELYYEEIGTPDAPTLVLLHGGIGTIEDFNKILPRLPTDFRLLGIDSRGHGRSTMGTDKLTYAQLQRDVEAVLVHLNLRTTSILGFSDGGIVAYRLAASSPPFRIEKLITLGSTWELKAHDPVQEIYRRVTPEGWRKKFPDTYTLYQRLNPRPDFDVLINSAVKMWQDASATGHPGARVFDIRSALLAVRGDNDPFTSRQSLATLTDGVKGSHFANLAFAGHVAFADQPEPFLAAVNAFLREPI
jgi:pimeloyl-ACP methyl ester carboxylesterase